MSDTTVYWRINDNVSPATVDFKVTVTNAKCWIGFARSQGQTMINRGSASAASGSGPAVIGRWDAAPAMVYQYKLAVEVRIDTAGSVVNQNDNMCRINSTPETLFNNCLAGLRRLATPRFHTTAPVPT
jgi:hypothetical protein